MPETSKGDFRLSLPSHREILLTRRFDAPRALVFEALTRPEHLMQWYGCNESRLTECQIDLRAGGAWRFAGQGPQQSVFALRGVYQEIVVPELLIYTESYDMPGMGWTPEATVTVILEHVRRGTRLTARILHQSPELRDGHVNSGMERGAAEAYDRLAAHVGTMTRRSEPALLPATGGVQ